MLMGIALLPLVAQLLLFFFCAGMGSALGAVAGCWPYLKVCLEQKNIFFLWLDCESIISISAECLFFALTGERDN